MEYPLSALVPKAANCSTKFGCLPRLFLVISQRKVRDEWVRNLHLFVVVQDGTQKKI